MTPERHWIEMLRCPHCASAGGGWLALSDDLLVCQEEGCGRVYPIHDGTPVMLTEEGDFLGFCRRLMNERADRNG